jgi:hypothetical protein
MFKRKDMLMVEIYSHPETFKGMSKSYVANFEEVDLQIWFDVKFETYTCRWEDDELDIVEFEFTIKRNDATIREALPMMAGRDGRGWWHCYSNCDGMETCSHENLEDACLEYAILYMLRFFN